MFYDDFLLKPYKKFIEIMKFLLLLFNYKKSIVINGN